MFIFRRLEINHESHEFILDSGTVVNSNFHIYKIYSVIHTIFLYSKETWVHYAENSWHWGGGEGQTSFCTLNHPAEPLDLTGQDLIVMKLQLEREQRCKDHSAEIDQARSVY